MEQRAACLPHKPKVVGSNPTPATREFWFSLFDVLPIKIGKGSAISSPMLLHK